MKLYNTTHYKSLFYKQPYRKKKYFNNRYIIINTERLYNKVFSEVNNLPKKTFVITHREDISTKIANQKAFNLMCGTNNRLRNMSLSSNYVYGDLRA